MTGQRERVLVELERRRRAGEPGLTARGASERGRGMRLAARINELRREGHAIITDREKTHAVYSLPALERRQTTLF